MEFSQSAIFHLIQNAYDECLSPKLAENLMEGSICWRKSVYAQIVAYVQFLFLYIWNLFCVLILKFYECSIPGIKTIIFSNKEK